MMMMLMLLQFFREFFYRNGLFLGVDLGFGPFENLVGLDAVEGVFYEFAVLHHAANIVGNPGLLGTIGTKHVGTHIAE